MNILKNKSDNMITLSEFNYPQAKTAGSSPFKLANQLSQNTKLSKSTIHQEYSKQHINKSHTIETKFAKFLKVHNMKTSPDL